jgi:fibro-slime domain-containing protein
MGGVHGKHRKSVMIDDIAKKMKLRKGRTYKLDMFYAQRDDNSASISFKSNLALR